ncbi:MAG: helix-turn-helix transcriptional regulator [Ktedonobacteraceae bacterium]
MRGSPRAFAGGGCHIDSFLMEAEKAQRQSNFLQDIQAVVSTVLADKIRLALFALPSGEVALIGAWRAEHEAQGEQLCRRCLHLVEGVLPHYHNHTFCITMLQTAVCRSYDELYERLNWLQKFSALRSVYGIGKKVHIKELSHYAAQPHLVEICRLLEKLGFYYREKMYVHYMHTIDNLAHALSDVRTIDYGTKKSVAQFLCHILPCQVTPEQNDAEWKRILQVCGEQRLLAQPKKDQGDMIAQVILFIEQNYQSDISITEIAERLQVTPNYLSALFHKKTGVTFVKYLTKIRLLRAKELLADPERRVQQVAELVGYTSTRHFTKIFTSSFGYYPSEQHKKSR